MVARKLLGFVRRWYWGQNATGGGTRAQRRRTIRRSGSERVSRTWAKVRANTWAKIAEAKTQLTTKWTLIPLAVIVILGGGLIARDGIYTWIDWNYRTENPHAELVPDSADLMVTIDLSRLRDPAVVDALNGWRQKATAANETEDAVAAMSEWTGRNFSDEKIAQWAGRRLTLMAGQWGAAIAVDVREKDLAVKWLEEAGNNAWIGWLDGDVVWIAETAAEERIAEAKRHGLRATIATTADYRRAREAHAMKGAQAEIFARWRLVPEPWKERLTTALDCAPNGWIGTRVRADHEGLNAEAICRAPERTWRARTLGDVTEPTWEIPERSAVWIVTTHPTDWQQLKSRLERASPSGAVLVDRTRQLIGDEEDAGLLASTAGAALAGWDSEEMSIHAAARLGEGKKKWLWTRWIG